MARKTPLAWLLLTKQKARLGVALAGIAFADILVAQPRNATESHHSGVGI